MGGIGHISSDRLLAQEGQWLKDDFMLIFINLQ